jgi:hypothetical protein
LCVLRAFSLTLGVVAGVASTLTWAAAPALADESATAHMNCLPGEGGAAKSIVNFYAAESPERFTAEDLCFDHHSAIAQWKVGSNPAIHKLWAHDGYGTGEYRDVTIAEGTPVKLRACYGEFGTLEVLGCSNWESGTA